MTERIARIEDIDVIKSLKRALARFAEVANVALTDAEGEMNRALMWLENEQRSYWDSQVRKRHDAVERAKEAVRMKKLFKDSAGRTPSAVDEEKALRQAQRRLEEAGQKVVNVKKYTQKLRKEILMYRGHVQRFATSVQNELPVAAAHLDALLERLEQYVSLDTTTEVRSAAPSASGPAGATPEPPGGMARPPAEPEPQAGAEAEPAPEAEQPDPKPAPPDAS